MIRTRRKRAVKHETEEGEGGGSVERERGRVSGQNGGVEMGVRVREAVED